MRTIFAALTFAALLGIAPRPAGAQLAPVPTLRRDDSVTVPQERPHAISHSDFYYKRLAVHRVASYVMLPLFAGELVLGNQLLHDDDAASWMRSAHSATAGGLGAVFGVNTVTGLWNLWDSRKDPGNGVRKYLHAALLLASDAGFVLTARAAPGDDDDGGPGASDDDARRHRDLALGSAALSVAGTAMMWIWK